MANLNALKSAAEGSIFGGLSAVKLTAVSTAATSGELVQVTAAGQTITTPGAVLGRIFGVFCAAGATSCKVKAASGTISGDFVSAAAEVTLLANQHVVLACDGTNWMILAGEPKREQV